MTPIEGRGSLEDGCTVKNGRHLSDIDELEQGSEAVAGLPYGVSVTQPWSERTTMATQVTVGEREATPAPPDARLAALERGGLWRWGATLTLLVALGVSVVTLYLGRAQAGGTDTPE